jgi:purine-nucleoside/S-methyl-5'-thioadenosine phosphorylase / adenosine deaminase
MSVLFSNDTRWLHAEGWRHVPRLVHGFSKRITDRDALLSQLGASALRLHTLRQIHGDEIVIINSSTPVTLADERPEADGLISADCGVLLGIATADCVPILMVDPQQEIVAALHAGWRGTLKGIVQRALALLVAHWNVDPQNLQVALGPSIGSCCYEVGPEVGEAIVERWRIQNPAAWRPVGRKGFLDLREVNLTQLAEAGVGRSHIARVGPCTFCDYSFASYRRDGAGAGRQLSVIGWVRR